MRFRHRILFMAATSAVVVAVAASLAALYLVRANESFVRAQDAEQTAHAVLIAPATDAAHSAERYAASGDAEDAARFERALATARAAVAAPVAPGDIERATDAEARLERLQRELDDLAEAVPVGGGRQEAADAARTLAASDAVHEAAEELEASFSAQSADAAAAVRGAALRVITLIAGLAALGLVGISVAAVYATRSVRRPLAALRAAVARMEAGNLEGPVAVTGRDEIGELASAFEAMRGSLRSALADLEQEIEERRLTEEALAESNHEMGVWLHEVEKTSEAVREMAAMSQTLQADLSVEEGLSVIAAYAERLFPELTGAVYLREDLGDEESPLVRRDGWGSADMMAETYARHECWSLRSGRPLQIWGGARALGVCAHAPEGTDCYACIPLVAHGEVFGTLVMEGCLDSAALPARGIAADSAETMQISFAEHVALALANLRFRERLKQESLTDHLTGLHNRRALEDALGREAARARRDGSALAIAMIDVDRFKEYNDVHGHEAGDRVLAAVGGFLKSRTRAGDLACRYGGEEFVLAWPGMTLENAYARAEQLRQAIADLRVTHEGTELRPVTVSVGIATFPDHGVTGEALLAAADVALYEAKAEGRDRVVVAELVACAVEREVTLSGQ
ncbi:MAG: diguanylate cyclase [Anaerosomatales bacterium]|nr:diguanylate cyclase [Anaerosomatales bacterium]